jgi:hypothetical protein
MALQTLMPVPNMSEFLNKLLHMALISDLMKQRSLGQLMGSILNKHADGASQDFLFGKILIN